jgi:glycerophosphoryl diester phosphodiesterase
MVRILRRTDGAVSLIAHRGGSGPWRENTLVAFAGARSNGADGVEFDVRLTSDGEAVVHHDPHLESGGVIARTKRRDLPEFVPELSAVVEACEGMFMDVEIKIDNPEPGKRPDPATCRALAAAVAEAIGRNASVAVSSFWPDPLVVLGEVAPGIRTGLLVHPALNAMEAVPMAENLGCSALLPHHSAVTAVLVDRSHEAGLEVGTWTVNTAADVRSVVDAGVEAVITDKVGLVRALLGREQSEA